MIHLLYHGLYESDPYHGFPGLRGLTVQEFDRQVQWLRTLCSIEQPSTHTQPLTRRGRPRVAITFDDGFGSFFRLAYPVLKHHNVPATVFVPSSFVGQGRYLWFSRLEVACLFGPSSPLALGSNTYGRRTRTERVETRRRLLAALRMLPWREADDWCTGLPNPEDILGPIIARALFGAMSEAELRQLGADPLIGIGSHTSTHPFLTMCDDVTLAEELGKSRDTLEALTRQPVRGISYPLGDYDSRVLSKASTYYSEGWVVQRSHPTVHEHLEIPRTGIYRPSAWYVAAKMASAFLDR